MKAKNILIAGLLTLGTLTFVEAQEENPGGFGLKGGIGISTLSFGDPTDVQDLEFKSSDNSWKIGGMVGITYEKRFGKVFALDIEALFANKGVKREQTFSFANNDGDVKTVGNLFAIDVPLSAKFYLGNNFNIYVGPYASYIVGGTAKSTLSYNGNSVSKETNNWYGDSYKDANGELPLNRFDVGANVGIEFVSNGGFGIGARFQKGFLDLTNDDYRGTYTGDGYPLFPADNKTVTNTGFQVYGIFRF